MLEIDVEQRAKGRYIYVYRMGVMQGVPQVILRFWQKGNNPPQLQWAHRDYVYLDDLDEAVRIVTNYVATT